MEGKCGKRDMFLEPAFSTPFRSVISDASKHLFDYFREDIHCLTAE